jgi:hypothetical protein
MAEMDTFVKGLLNGKRPPERYFTGNPSLELAEALAQRIDAGVAPSLCAHAMCGSASVGNVAVVRMLSQRPMSTFNKAYNFSEPLRRAIRAYLRATDPARKADFKECAKLLITANAGLHHPDKNSPSGMTAARILKENGSADALALLQELESPKVKSEVKEEGNLPVKDEKSAKLPPAKKRKGIEVSTEAPAAEAPVTARAKKSRK